MDKKSYRFVGGPVGGRVFEVNLDTTFVDIPAIETPAQFGLIQYEI
jgi:hypothetical protein